MIYPLYLLLLSLAPGLLWLLYFLRKDVHPEPRKMILKIFALGMLSAIPAIVLELLFSGFYFPSNTLIYIPGVTDLLLSLGVSQKLTAIIDIFIGVALVEELMKYLVVRFWVLRDPEMDEPVDIILYMIISALGFATLENIIFFRSPDVLSYTAEASLSLAAFRFISATFLHALASGTIGFFTALSFCEVRNKKLLFFSGFTLAVLLHGLYDFSIMNVSGGLRIAILSAIIIGLAIFIYWGIQYLRKKKSICKI